MPTKKEMRKLSKSQQKSRKEGLKMAETPIFGQRKTDTLAPVYKMTQKDKELQQRYNRLRSQGKIK